MAEARAQLAAGRAVNFGPLQASREGLQYRAAGKPVLVKWPALGLLELEGGTLYMKNFSRETMLADSAEIPNLAVLLALAAQDFHVDVR